MITVTNNEINGTYADDCQRVVNNGIVHTNIKPAFHMFILCVICCTKVGARHLCSTTLQIRSGLIL